MVFLLLVSWWYGPSSFERFDPVEAAREERDAAIKECNNAQHAWAEMGTKHERALITILKLEDEFRKAYKDLPWLTKRNTELGEDNIVQHNEIERLKFIEQKYDELLQQVATYGLTAKRPEYYQTKFESVQRELEIANYHLQKSEKCVKALEEKSLARETKVEEEKEWLRAKVKKNSRSVAYWAKSRMVDRQKPWGVRCACTEPEIAYALKDQTPRITQLEATVAARDLTIARLRERHGNHFNNDTASVSNAAKAQLREECQVSRDAAPNHTAIDDTKGHLGEDWASKEAEIENLRAEKVTASEELAAKIEEIGNLREQIRRKDIEIDDLETANQELAEEPASEFTETLQRLRTANTELEEVRRELAECKGESETQTQRLRTVNADLDGVRRELADCKGQSETQTARIEELEAEGREKEATTKLKDDEIARLEEQISQAPTSEFVERQNQSHNEVIVEKDRNYRTLYDEYQQTLGQQQLAEAQRNQDIQTINTLQQNDTTNQQELRRLHAENQNLHMSYANSNRQVVDLSNQPRHGGGAYTDLQIRYNAQETEPETANQTIGELQSQVSNLQQANGNLRQANTPSETDVERYRREGADRAHSTWQANFDRAMSAKTLELGAQEGLVSKLEKKLQEANKQASPLREMQLKSREDAVKLREDALKKQSTTEDTAMDHDQPASKAAVVNPQIEKLETLLAAANKEASDAKLRNRGIRAELDKERKERGKDKVGHEKELKREREEAKMRGDVLRLKLEKENPLRPAVSKLQDEVARLKEEIEKQKGGGSR